MPPLECIVKTKELWKAFYHHPYDVFSQVTNNKDGATSNYYAWSIVGKNLLVIPSMSFSKKELEQVNGYLHYEERVLYVLFGLSCPSTKLAIVTSLPLDEFILKYHLSLIPLHPNEYKDRFKLYNVGDGSLDTCLSEKILNHPHLLQRLKCDNGGGICSDDEHGCERVMMVYRSSSHEEKLAELLDMSFYSARHDQAHFGTKDGSRQIFQNLSIPHTQGSYQAEKDLGVLMKSMWRILRCNPQAKKGLVKLSDGFSGFGNAEINVQGIQERLAQLPEVFHEKEVDCLLETQTLKAFETMKFHGRDWKSFRGEITQMGAIFELFIENAVTSPSVQVVIEDGIVSVLSTHEQILDEDQIYQGCEFPARAEYRKQLMEYGQRIGEYLKSFGVTDHFGVDFLCVQPQDTKAWEIYAGKHE